MALYKVLIGCQNDRTGKRFEPGDACTDKDFSKAVIKNWLEIGVLEDKATRKKKVKD